MPEISSAGQGTSKYKAKTLLVGTPAVFLLLIYKSSACVVEQGFLHGRVASLAPSSVSSLGQ